MEQISQNIEHFEMIYNTLKRGAPLMKTLNAA